MFFGWDPWQTVCAAALLSGRAYGPRVNIQPTPVQRQRLGTERHCFNLVAVDAFTPTALPSVNCLRFVGAGSMQSPLGAEVKVPPPVVCAAPARHPPHHPGRWFGPQCVCAAAAHPDWANQPSAWNSGTIHRTGATHRLATPGNETRYHGETLRELHFEDALHSMRAPDLTTGAGGSAICRGWVQGMNDPLCTTGSAMQPTGLSSTEPVA